MIGIRAWLCSRSVRVVGVLVLAVWCVSCSKQTDDGADPKVTTLGGAEVTGRLVEILGLEEWEGKFPSNDLGYDYVYVLKYSILETHRGKVESDTILVGQYNPLKPRSEAADARCPEIGGNLRRFRAGDLHRMALDEPLDDHYMGPIINKYFKETGGKGVVYWAVWTNRVIR